MELIFKMFIKDKDNVKDEKVRSKYGELAGTTGIVLNLVLCVIKFVAGIITASISITADAFNNLSDAGSSIITLIGFKLSGKPADNDHPFGHGRIEYICALIVSLAIVLMGFELGKTSVLKIINPENVEFSIVGAVILIIAISVKCFMYFFNKKIGEKINSASMIATAKDSLSDCVSTTAVLLSLLTIKLFKVNVDGYAGLLVSLFILYTGYETAKDSLSPLLGVAPDKELVEDIEETVKKHEICLGIHDMIIHNYGPTRFMMSLHVEVPASGNILDMHDEIDIIEKELSEKYKCVAVIHMDPVENDSEIVASLKEMTKNTVGKISSELSIHDFRIVSGPTHTNLIFDVVVPFEFMYKDEELVNEIANRIKEVNGNYNCVINVDKKW